MSKKLAIKINNCALNDPCGICGRRTDPDVGPELFLADSWHPVCWQCGEKHAPALVRLLEFRQLVESTIWTLPTYENISEPDLRPLQ